MWLGLETCPFDESSSLICSLSMQDFCIEFDYVLVYIFEARVFQHKPFVECYGVSHFLCYV